MAEKRNAFLAEIVDRIWSDAPDQSGRWSILERHLQRGHAELTQRYCWRSVGGAYLGASKAGAAYSSMNKLR